MAVGVLVQALGVLEVAAVGIDAVEGAVGLVVPAGAEVVVIHRRVVLFAAVQEARAVGGGGLGRIRSAAQHHTVAVVGVRVADVRSAGAVRRVGMRDQVPRRAVAVVEQVLRTRNRPCAADVLGPRLGQHIVADRVEDRALGRIGRRVDRGARVDPLLHRLGIAVMFSLIKEPSGCDQFTKYK